MYSPFLMDDPLASKLTMEKSKRINFQISACMCTAAHRIWCTFEQERWHSLICFQFFFPVYTTTIRNESIYTAFLFGRYIYYFFLYVQYTRHTTFLFDTAHITFLFCLVSIYTEYIIFMFGQCILHHPG